MDANARSRLWHCEEEDEKGDELEIFIQHHNLAVINRSGQPSTHVAGGNIDLTLATQGLARKIHSWTVHETASSSDHRLITMELTIVGQHPTFKKSANFNIKKINPNDVNSELERRLSTPDKGDCEQKAKWLNDTITQVLELLCPRVVKVKNSVPWWNKTLTDIRARVKRARRNFQKSRDVTERARAGAAYRTERNAYFREIREAKKTSWENFVRRNINEDPYGFAFKLGASKLRLKEVLTNLKIEGNYTNTTEETLKQLLDDMMPLAEGGQAPVEDIEGPNDEPDFSIDDLNVAIKRAKARRAPGPDHIPIDVVKTFSPEILRYVLELFNLCWQQGVFPKVWKEASITILRKGGDRDWSLPGSYRPISLLPVLGKTFERLIHSRIMSKILSENILAPNQYGFMPGRSTTDAIMHVTSSAQNNILKYTIALFLDIKGAFNELWWPSILDSLRRLGFSRQIQRIMQSYLSERSVTLTAGHCRIGRVVNKGCPQGSVLGPLLWNLVLDGLLKERLPEHAEILAFADDTVVLVHGDSRLELERKAEVITGILENWATSVRMTFSPEKTQAIILKGTLARGRPPTVKIANRTVRFCETVTFLGVTLDKKLSFHPHAKNVSAKANALFQKLLRIVKLKYGVMPQAYEILYKTVYRPIIQYAQRAWVHRTTNSLIKKTLRATQRKILLGISGAYRTVSYAAITVLMGQAPIDLAIQEMHALWEVKCNISNETPQGIKLETLRKWQEEWDHSENGRHTFAILPTIIERLKFKHLRMDHWITQLLSGHGAFKTYLFKHGKTQTDACEDCGDLDHPGHAVLECRKYHSERTPLKDICHSKNIGWLPNLRDLIQDPEVYRVLYDLWKYIKEDRGI